MTRSWSDHTARPIIQAVLPDFVAKQAGILYARHETLRKTYLGVL
jgi:hypothetical protein